MEKVNNWQSTTTISQDRLSDEDKSKLDSLLVCIICKGIVWKPEKCQGCQTYFCQSCITSKLIGTTQRNCPSCQNEYVKFNADKIVLNFLSIFASFAILGKLQLKCINEKQGCKELIGYNDLENHEKECPFRIEPCINFNLGCEQKLMKKEKPAHEANCPFFCLNASIANKI